jgi:hypothetical protein
VRISPDSSVNPLYSSNGRHKRLKPDSRNQINIKLILEHEITREGKVAIITGASRE